MDTVSVLFAGVGGQGIVLASKILALSAFLNGLMVKESELHGMAQRGGSVVSHVRFGSKVYSPLIPLGTADILVSLEKLEGLRYINYLKKDGKVIFNENTTVPSTVNPETGLIYPDDAGDKMKDMNYEIIPINAKDIAKEVGNMKVENIAVLGLLSKYLQIPEDVWKEAISKAVPQKTIEVNLLAFKKGREININ